MSYHIVIRNQFTPPRMVITKTLKIKSISKKVEKLETSHTADEEVKWFSCSGKQFRGSSKM